MAIQAHDQRLLAQKSGNRCAICRRLLTAEGGPADRDAILGEMAHIVAESPNGPRGTSPLTLEERNKYENLILLCNVDHQRIDDQPQTYTVEKLHGIKVDHERWVEQTLSKGLPDASPHREYKTETVYSTLLPVVELPRFVYGVAVEGLCEDDIKKGMAPARVMKKSLTGATEMAPFIVRGAYLYAFQNMNDRDNPFKPFAPGQSTERFRADEWWDDPDHMRWYVDLLNRSLNKLTGRRGLHYDKEHRRYYFPMEEPGKEVEIAYRPLNQRRTRRKVVWEPTSKKTGEGRGKWLHRAVALRFTPIDEGHWCLGIRPELRITVDGYQPLESTKIGAQVTRRKSRMFNYDLLGEVHFWRDFLSDSAPRIILPFGPKQRVVISTTFMSGVVAWPGIPPEYDKPFGNVAYVDNLFSWAEYAGPEEDDDGQDWQDETEDEDVDDIG